MRSLNRHAPLPAKLKFLIPNGFYMRCDFTISRLVAEPSKTFGRPNLQPLTLCPILWVALVRLTRGSPFVVSTCPQIFLEVLAGLAHRPPRGRPCRHTLLGRGCGRRRAGFGSGFRPGVLLPPGGCARSLPSDPLDESWGGSVSGGSVYRRSPPD